MPSEESRAARAGGEAEAARPSEAHRVRLRVNGIEYARQVEPRLLLSDFLRHGLGLTGTHVGCEHGVCGACTVLMDGRAIRSCLTFAVQADGREVLTVEGLASGSADRAAVGGMPGLHPLQEAFREAHGLQCGFCTPGFLMTLLPFLEENPEPSEEEIREAISGNLCRCTGYEGIVAAVRLAARRARESEGTGSAGGEAAARPGAEAME